MLTTAALIREIDSLRERTTHDNEMLREIVETRLTANDAEVALLRSAIEKIPALISEAVGSLQKLHEEKFQSIGIQFKESDVRTDQTSRDSKVAVDAALKAQQEAFAEQNKSSALAISKSEAAFIEALKQQQALFQTEIKAANDKIGVLTSRLDKGEGTSGAVITAHTENRLNVGQLMTAGGLILLAVSIVISAVALHH